MAKDLYEAFVKAGFARVARTLSESDKNGRPVPTLGHYIAIVGDGIGRINPSKTAEAERTLYVEAIDKTGEFIRNNYEKFNIPQEKTNLMASLLTIEAISQ